MNPERQYDEHDSKANVRPRFGVIQGGDETSEPRHGHLSEVDTTPDEDESGGLRVLEGGGETSAPKRGHLKAVDGSDLKDREETAADNTLNKGYTGRGKSSPEFKAAKKRFWNKKKAGIAGLGSGILVGGGMFGMTFISGPLEFIHLANTLHDAHFSQQESAGDGRMGKVYRFIRSGGDQGTTRLSWLGNKYHGKIIAELRSIGIEPIYTEGSKLYKGFTVDTEHENSPYKGMTSEEAARAFEAKTGVKPELKGGKLSVNADTYWSQRKALKASLADLGLNGVVTAARARILGKYAKVSFHPLSRQIAKLDDKLNTIAKAKFKQYKDKWDNRIKNGTEPATVDGTGAKQEATDENGKPTTEPVSEADKIAISDSPKNASKILTSLKTGGAVAGGVAAAAGLVCALKSLDDSIGAIVYTQNLLPMMRVGLEAVSVGHQIESGQDVDPQELQYLSHFFNSKAGAEGHAKATSWTDSAPIRADMHETGGIDINKGIKDAVKEQKPSWLDWTQNGAVSGLCSTGAQVATTIVGVVVGVVSGGVISTVSGLVISAALTGPIINFLAGILSGDALDIAKLAGTDYGSVADYGATMGANAAAVVMGGTEFLGNTLSDVNTQVATDQREEFDSESFLKRTFDLKDYRSLASVVTMNQTGNFTTNLFTTMRGVTGSFASVLRMPLNLYGSTVHAATPGYQYPFPIYGFSLADQANSVVNDPFANAENVAQMLSGPSGSDYIKKANDCFGVNITKENADGVWDVIPDHDINLYDTTSYHPDDCSGLTKVSSVKSTRPGTLASASTTIHGNTVVIKTAADTTTYTQDTNWLKMRFFILDTSVMEGYTCAKFNDADSCATNTGNAAVAPPSTGTNTDQSAIFQDSTGIPCAPGSIQVGKNTGYHNGQPVPIMLCAVPDIPSSSQESNGGYGITGANGAALVNSRVSANFVDLAKKAKAAGHPLSATSSFRTMQHQTDLCNQDSRCPNGDYTYVAKPGTSNHQMGLAIDFNLRNVKANTTSCVGRAEAPGDGMWDWLNNNAAQNGIHQYANESWHWETLTGPTDCGGDGSK
jgi:hypothetical protein